jgi:hypothetical protein
MTIDSHVTQNSVIGAGIAPICPDTARARIAGFLIRP